MTNPPKPIDASDRPLDPALEALAGQLAANASDGRFDREAAVDMLKQIRAQGFQIVPPPEDAAAAAAVAPTASIAELAGLASAPPLTLPALKKMSVGQMIQLWQAWDREKFRGTPNFYKQAAERAIKLGEPLLAFDILKAALKLHPHDVALRQVQAVALSRSGVVEEATKRLQELLAEGQEDEETLGNLARTLKDHWEAASDVAVRRRLLEDAFRAYEGAYRHPKGGYWTGINAATLAACLDWDDRAEQLAREIETECRRRLESLTEDDAYWELATLGEAALVRRDFAGAESWFLRAAKVAGDQYGNIGSTRRNAALLLRHFVADMALLDRWLPMPRVVVFSGHMIDRPGRRVPRFPAELEASVAAEIKRHVDALDVRFGYASAACGSDILFLEAVAARGGEVNVVLPYELDRFMLDSVCLEPGSPWEARLRALLAREQTRRIVASQGDVQDIGVSNEYANQFTFGLAGIRAFQMRTELAALTVWDGRPGDGAGGTASAVARWRTNGIQPIIVDLAELLHREVPEKAKLAEAQAGPRQNSVAVLSTPPGELSGQMMALLFADVVGFSKLTEEEMPLFVEHFLKPVAQLCDHGQGCPAPVQRNTWGDGLYFVFKNVQDAGLFALALRDRVTKTDWVALGFRKQLSLRTGLHVGPVYKCRNPVTGREDYLGTHVSRAARIEPITPKGEVYASEVFAAITFADRVEGFTCDYVGQIGLAKEYGTYPTYHVRRR